MRSRTVQVARLYNRSLTLTRSLSRYRPYEQIRDRVRAYNTLRKDVKRFVNDPNFDRCVPPARDYFFWMTPIAEVRNRADVLNDYLRDYITVNHPTLTSQVSPQAREEMELQLARLEERNYELEEDLAEKTDQLDHLREMLRALETPSYFEVPQQVLDKLDPLERTRLLEAVQAYRVNAWTPTAAVCGMILEGRLQRLCHENSIRPGGIGDMIRRLGEVGLLKSYYQNLAQVGEFFRHRASHPTSEEFDREKTTLVLTSLIILVRDLF